MSTLNEVILMKLSTSQKTKKKKNLKYSANKISPPRYVPAPSCAAPPVAHVHAWLHPPPAAAALLTSAQQKHSSPAGKKKKARWRTPESYYVQYLKLHDPRPEISLKFETKRIHRIYHLMAHLLSNKSACSGSVWYSVKVCVCMWE